MFQIAYSHIVDLSRGLKTVSKIPLSLVNFDKSMSNYETEALRF